jgi:hypothetical protein
MLFIKSVSHPRARMLYVMGATWHTKCMFDLDSIQPSFADILQEKNIETYAFDIFGGGPGAKPLHIDNLHNSNVQYARMLVEFYNIDIVMGYSYGCLVAKEVAQLVPLKGIIMLDPESTIDVARTQLGNGRVSVGKQAIKEALRINQTSIDPVVEIDYIDSVDPSEELITAQYPGQVCREQNKLLRSKTLCPGLWIVTKQGVVDQHIEASRYADASHWILLESHRYQLADDVVKFIDASI